MLVCETGKRERERDGSNANDNWVCGSAIITFSDANWVYGSATASLQVINVLLCRILFTMAGNYHIRQWPTDIIPSTHAFAETLHDSHGGGSARDGGEGEEAAAAMAIAGELETAEQVSHYTVVLMCHTQSTKRDKICHNETKSTKP